MREKQRSCRSSRPGAVTVRGRPRASLHPGHVGVRCRRWPERSARKEEDMVDNPRARKLADRIKEIVAQLLDTRIKDPRLGFVTVTDVRVTGGLQNASVFYTVYGSDEERAGTAAALESAKGLIRSEVGKQTGIRLTPTIEFHLDSVPETAAHLDAALVEARRRDAELAALREGKTFAGDADPYRTAEDDEADEG